ncbi:hypothetical protein LTR08_004357 [Meristemomyces frigidus]|nr:hypothetical protein LTR08_004357 [Meristemomyces frigidus]
MRRLRTSIQATTPALAPARTPPTPPLASNKPQPALVARRAHTMTTPDYTTYTPAALLARVTDLEAQLRALNTAHRTFTPPPLSKKPPKAHKPFDPTNYNFRFIALKFAYLGGGYNGFEHHANNATPLPTIEEVLWTALRKTRLIFPVYGDGVTEGSVCWEGVGYSKCGRTDKGVSAFGQVVGLRVRSSRPKDIPTEEASGDAVGEGGGKGAVDVGDSLPPNTHAAVTDNRLNATASDHPPPPQPPTWDPITDEHPYIQLLNRVLPPDIRILAWCPHPPPDFSARFSCRERRYRYFFTNPAYACAPGSPEGRLDVAAMQEAAQKLEGVHDFRNFCKVDPGKQITNFERRIFHAGIHTHTVGSTPPLAANGDASGTPASMLQSPELFYFEVRGSAFLWHQVRHLVAILFLVGQGYEKPEIVDYLLDTDACPGKPVYDMADDRPLVLWECVFPDLEELRTHSVDGHSDRSVEDTLEWVYVGAEAGGRDGKKRVLPGVDDGFFGRNGIMDDLWALWRKRKIDEVLAGGLMDVVLRRHGASASDAVVDGHVVSVAGGEARSDRVFDGSDGPRLVGKYVPLMRRKRMEAPGVLNKRYALRKGLVSREGGSGEVGE